MYNIERANKCFFLKISKNDYNYFRRQGQKLHKIFENNGQYKTEQDYYDACDIIINKLSKRTQLLGLYYFLQTDPRKGATLYINKHPIDRDRYTDAVCIY